jgi:hypothetical protein
MLSGARSKYVSGLLTLPCLLWTSLFSSAASGSASVPHSKHIWIITEENHIYESLIGNPNAPTSTHSPRNSCWPASTTQTGTVPCQR